MATILVVNGNAINRESLLKLLDDGGYRVLEAADGEKALALARAEHPDLIITDVLMPLMNGYEFVQRLQADPAIAPTQVMFCTAYSLNSPARRRTLIGKVAHALSKPHNPEVVLLEAAATLNELQRRTKQLEHMKQRQEARFAITRLLASASSVQEAASGLLQIWCEYLDWDLGELWMLDSDSQRLRCETLWHRASLEMAEFVAVTRQTTLLRGQDLAGRAWASGKPLSIGNLIADAAFLRLHPAAQAGLQGAVSFPIRSNGQVIGVMGLFSRKSHQCDQELLDWFADIGGELAHFVERRRAEDVLRQLSGQLLQLQDEERRRLARELHDSTAQNLTAVAVNLALVKNSTAALDPQACHSLEESLKLVKESVKEIRTLSYLLHPPLLEERGLAPALSWYLEGFTRRSGIQVHVDVPPELGRLPADVELALFRIVQEGLTNIHLHSGSETAHVWLARNAQHILLTVADQGRGMPAGLQQKLPTTDPLIGVGIAGMRERVRQLGGQFEIHAGNPGTTLLVTLPVDGGRL
jgi:signal transduction histidine kinase